MSRLLSKATANLLGGVSQQPERARFANMAKESTNMWPAITSGLDKRRPTEHFARVLGTAPADLKFHLVARDPTERYAVFLYDDGVGPMVKAWDLVNNEEVPVYDSGGALIANADLAYLDSVVSFEEDVQLLTVADHTFVLNRQVTVATTGALSGSQLNQAVLQIRAAAAGLRYGIEVDGLDEARHKFDSTGAYIETDNAAYRLAVVADPSPPTNFVPRALLDDPAFVEHPKVAAADSGSRTKLKAKWFSYGNNLGAGGAGTSYPFGYPADGTNVYYLRIRLKTPGGTWYDGPVGPLVPSDAAAQIQAALAAAAVAAGWTPAPSYNGPTFTVTKVVPSQGTNYWEIVANWTSQGDEVARIYQGTVTPDPANVDDKRYWLRRFGSTIWLARIDAGEFKIKTRDGLGDTAIRLATLEVESYDRLPTVCVEGMVVKVRGDEDAEEDDYWVKFAAKGVEEYQATDQIVEGTWAETIGPGLEYRLDASTMPHTLKSYIDDGTGFVGVAGEPYFVWDVHTWADRLVGDDTTNTMPSFVGQKVNALAYYRSRLALLSQESVCLSEAGDTGNFFRVTVISDLDTDRIDLTARSTRVAILRAAAEVQEQLLLFSDNAPFRLDAGGDLLTPRTASLLQLGNYDLLSKVPPVPVGPVAYYAFPRGAFSGVGRFFADNAGNSTTWRADEVTAHVPRYLAGGVVAMAACPVENLLVAVPETRSILYLFKWHDIGSERVQAAWFRWNGLGTIRGVGFIESTMWLAVERESEIYLERVRIEDGLVDTGSWYFARLDRRVDQDACTVTYEASGPGTTDIILPYEESGEISVLPKHQPGQDDQVVTQATGAVAGGQTTIVLAGDWTGVDLWAGVAFEARHELSEPYVEGPAWQGQTALLGGRLQVRRAIAYLDDAGYFSAEVTPEHRATTTQTVAGSVPGEATPTTKEPWSRSVSIRVDAVAGGFALDLVNSSPWPSPFVSLEWEATYHSRGRRVG